MVHVDRSPAFRGIDFDPRSGVFADTERLREAALGAHSLADILRKLGLRPSGTRYAQLRAALTKHGIRRPTKDLLGTRKSAFADREAVRRAVQAGKTQKGALELLGVSLAGKNYERLAAVCAIYRIALPPRWGVECNTDAERRRRLEEEAKRERWRILDDDEVVRKAVSDAPNWCVAAQRLWGANDVSDRQALKSRSAELSIAPRIRRSRGILDDREAVAAAVVDAKSMVEALTRLGLALGAHQRLVLACEEYGLKVPRADRSTTARISHEKAKASYRWGHPDEVLQQGSSASQRRIRNMLLRYELLPYTCAVCDSLPEWRGEPLVLILDHKNGDPSDHRLENLRFVCPNCESQLPTHGSRNRKKAA